MNHPLLDPHDRIAWDMDGTLIDGPHSEFFSRYIVANPHKEHHIVTFRDGAWARQAPMELFLRYGVAREAITGVHDCPQHLWAAYAQQKSFFQPALVEEYIHWKGMKAAELGCTVLIDDMPALVTPGCERHGVVFLHALHPDFGGY